MVSHVLSKKTLFVQYGKQKVFSFLPSERSVCVREYDCGGWLEVPAVYGVA